MFKINLSPVIFQIGPIQATYYAFAIIFGFLAGLFVFLRAIKNKKINMTEEQMYSLGIYSLLGILIGARLFHAILWNLDFYLANPINIFFIWQGGFSFHGGLVGAAIVAYFFCKKHKINLAKLADILTLPAIFLLILIRISNFANAEILGKVTSLPWCVQFAGIEGCRHPTQIYATLALVVIFLIIFVTKQKKNIRTGSVFWLAIALISVQRFLFDFLRTNITAFPSTGQWLSIILILLAAYVLYKKIR